MKELAELTDTDLLMQWAYVKHTLNTTDHDMVYYASDEELEAVDAMQVELDALFAEIARRATSKR